LLTPTPSQAFSNLCDGYFHTLVAYIYRNPQKHGLVADFRDWPYASYDLPGQTGPVNRRLAGRNGTLTRGSCCGRRLSPRNWQLVAA